MHTGTPSAWGLIWLKTKMFWVLDGTVTACRMQRYQVAIVEHQATTNDRLQQLYTATGVVWTACQTNGAISSQVARSHTVQWTTDNCRQLEMNTLREWTYDQWKLGSVSVMWSENRRLVMDRAPALSTNCRRLYVVSLHQHSIAVVEPWQDESDNKHMVHGCRNWSLDTAQLA